MAPIGVAILGSGIFVSTEHLPAVLDNPEFSLRAIYSRTLASAKKLESTSADVALYSDDSPDQGLDTLLKRSDVEAVIIALPILIQPDIIKRCLDAGKHVLSEKPVAPHLTAAYELINWKRKHHALGPLWSVAENFRYQGAWYFARERIEALGRILTFSAHVQSLTDTMGRYYNTAWRKDPQYQGGFILDAGVHSIAALRILLGEEERIERLAAFSAMNYEHLPPVDTVTATCRTKGGKVGQITLSWGTTDRAWEFRVGTEGGVVAVAAGGIVTVTKTDGDVQTKAFVEDGSGVPQELHGFAKAIREGSLEKRQTPESAAYDLEIIERMLYSGENGGEPQGIAWKV